MKYFIILILVMFVAISKEGNCPNGACGNKFSKKSFEDFKERFKEKHGEEFSKAALVKRFKEKFTEDQLRDKVSKYKEFLANNSDIDERKAIILKRRIAFLEEVISSYNTI